MITKIRIHEINDDYFEEDMVAYTEASKEEIAKAIDEAREMISYWLSDDDCEKPERWDLYEEQGCWCDQEFCTFALELNLQDLRYEQYDDEVIFTY